MTRYFDRERRDWRARLHSFLRRANALLACAVLLLAVLWPAQVGAGDGSCGAGWTRISHGCRAANMRSVRCDTGYEGRFRKVDGHWVGRCAPGPIVRGG